MAPAPKKGVRAKGAAGEVNKGPPIRKSVDGDGCWDVASNERLDCFEFVGAQGSPARPSEGGSETAVMRSKYAGKWRTIMGEQCYMTGVHYLAMRVEGHSRSGLPATDIGSSWLVGVCSRNCPLDGELSDLAHIEMSGAQGGFGLVGGSAAGLPKVWALGLSNYIEHPLGAGRVMAAPSTIVRMPANTRPPGESVALIPHNAKLHGGDVVGMRLDVDAATVGFWVNSKHIKDVQLNVDSSSWVPMASSSNTRVKFSLLTKAEQLEARCWDALHRHQMQEAVIQGSKVLGAAGRASEGRALADALAAGHAQEAEQLLLWGVEPSRGWMDELASDGIITVRSTIQSTVVI